MYLKFKYFKSIKFIAVKYLYRRSVGESDLGHWPVGQSTTCVPYFNINFLGFRGRDQY